MLKFEEIEKAYNEIEKGKAGIITSRALALSLGFEEAAKVLSEAVKRNKKIKLVYGKGEDNLKEVLFY